jgi:pimeloyl-ACP methyl ester carboxylesterase
MKILFFIVFFLFSVIFAEEDYDKAVSQYKKIPQNINEEVSWLKPYNETFLPYNRCGEVENFEITDVDERVDYYWDSKENLFDINHYYCLVSIVRITYRVSCLNKLQYEGVFYLLSEPKKLNETLNPSDKEVEHFKSQQHDWISKPFSCLKSDGKFDETCSEFDDYNGIFDKQKLIDDWKKQKVAYPEWKYMGVPGKKLARPVIFIHGLNSSYDVWGVVPLTEVSGNKKKLEKSFQQGLVRKYENGSAPDIIARMQNIDNTETNINKNGIYFFQAPGTLVNGEWIEAGLEWDNKNASNSQSRKLYQQLINVLDDFYGTQGFDWKNSSDLVVDLVAHSQGGLVVREMLRGLLDDGSSSGTDNAANHIGKIITVDTPHFGSELAIDNTENIKAEFIDLKLIIDDLNAQEKGMPNIHKLVHAKLDMNWYDYARETNSGFIDAYNDISLNGPNGIFQILSPLVNLLGWTYGTATDWFTEITLTITGPYMGKYVPEIYVDGVGPGPFNVRKTLDTIYFMDDVSKEFRKIRKNASHLDIENDFMKKMEYKYPQRPDGSNVVMLPLYSPSTKNILAEVFLLLGEEANKICEQNDESRECFAVGDYFEHNALKMAEAQGVNNVYDTKINDTLWNALLGLQKNWLSQSDIAVTEYSQKFINQDLGIIPETEPNGIKGFKLPRPYLFHDALAPWEDVLHMPIENINDGATRQGLDIACALDYYCDNTLQKKNSKLIYLNQGNVALSGDFDIAPIFVASGSHEVTISDGIRYLKAAYVPGVGSLVSYSDENKTFTEDVVVGSDISTTPSVSREGENISVSFNNYSGKSFVKTYSIPKLSKDVVYAIKNGDGGAVPKVVAGIANVKDISSQEPPKPPKDKFYARSSVFAMHREARGDYETNTSRPRILVANASENDIEGFKVAYYFTADPARNPIVEVDYPQIPVTLENLGGDQWRFVLDASDLVLNAKSIFPNEDGWQIRIHYNDWSDYKYLNDWSANYNIGMPELNRKIVIYDKKGDVLWGKEPKIFKSTDDDVVSSPKGVLSWSDSAPWEKNMFKPQVTVKNTGVVALKDYHAKLWFRVPEGKELYIPVDDWYTPVSKPSLENVGENVWELDMYFDEYLLYPNESVVEGNIGLHLTDWSIFDKLVCGVALIDSEENVLFGKVPSVDECKSYNEKTLIMPQYAWSY